VFEVIAAANPSARPRAGLPLVLSVVVHATAVMVLFTISLTDAVKVVPASRIRAMTLLEPIPTPVPIASPVRAEVRRAPAHLPRLFRPEVVPAAVLAPVVVAPAIDIPRPLLPVVELRPLRAVAPPPLKIDNFAVPLVVVPQAAPTSAAVQLSGFSMAKPAEAPAGGRLKTAGFASVATGDDAALRRPMASLSRAGFGDAVISDAAGDPARGAVNPAAAPRSTRPVEILSKPKPIYSDEGRRLQIEGEVLLEALFSASGQVRILRTVRGLGHGLDENAIAAAEAIRFRPAERAGLATDSTAIVHIAFHLAF
jgi:TonB family protein